MFIYLYMMFDTYIYIYICIKAESVHARRVFNVYAWPCV